MNTIFAGTLLRAWGCVPSRCGTGTSPESTAEGDQHGTAHYWLPSTPSIQDICNRNWLHNAHSIIQNPSHTSYRPPPLSLPGTKSLSAHTKKPAGGFQTQDHQRTMFYIHFNHHCHFLIVLSPRLISTPTSGWHHCATFLCRFYSSYCI